VVINHPSRQRDLRRSQLLADFMYCSLHFFAREKPWTYLRPASLTSSIVLRDTRLRPQPDSNRLFLFVPQIHFGVFGERQGSRWRCKRHDMDESDYFGPNYARNFKSQSATIATFASPFPCIFSNEAKRCNLPFGVPSAFPYIISNEANRCNVPFGVPSRLSLHA
jgi:hypothetical protein